MYDDTIAAIATPPGRGGIGIVRLSGHNSLSIIQHLFRPRRTGTLRSHHVRYGHIVDPADGSVVDEVLVTFMRAPQSYTCEDVVEISCHGGPVPLQRMLALVLKQGARLAEPGEFTLRAFLHGRIDLSQAEATLDIINAQTNIGLALAQAQLGGWLAQEIRRIRSRLMDVLAYVTVTIDFPEDDVEQQDIAPALEEILADVTQLLATADQGMMYRQGARAVLVGRPNVGKSSLLNVLLRMNRSIVTPIPGTTRDTIEETANLSGIPVVLIDTAGIVESTDPIERLGVERSREALSMADLALLVFDVHQPLTDDDVQIAALTYEKPTFVVWNKADLTDMGFTESYGTFAHPLLVGSVVVSTVTGFGIDKLVQGIVHVLTHGSLVLHDGHLITNPRHRDTLSRAAESLQSAKEGQENAVPIDVLAGDLTTALHALGEITGETVTEDLLNTIFSRFCIGK